jgi:hypothetical protein
MSNTNRAVAILGSCVAVWLYVGTAAQGMTSCAEQGGTWVNP